MTAAALALLVLALALLAWRRGRSGRAGSLTATLVRAGVAFAVTRLAFRWSGAAATALAALAVLVLVEALLALTFYPPVRRRDLARALLFGTLFALAFVTDPRASG